MAKLRGKYHYKSGVISAEMEIDLGRFEKQYSKAQYELDSAVMEDMVPFMPMVTGQFINVTKAMSQSVAGSGKVIAAAPPFGRFLYGGKVMVGVTSNSPWAKSGEKKVITDKNLQYSTGAHPQAQARWFDPTKKKNVKRWVKNVKKTAGGGK